jgi:hypothetical protein
MDLTKLTNKQFQRIVELLKEKETLTARLATVDAELRAFQGAAPQGKPSKRKRGEIKRRIIAELQKAGANGVKVTELAKRLNRRGASVHVWFNTTGRKIPQIVRAGRGLYRWKTK